MQNKLTEKNPQQTPPHPILYSFRRCPFAMRGRMGLYAAGLNPEVREITLRDKPPHMLEISPKGTVPVLWLEDGSVIDESLDVMLYALNQKDPNNWLKNKKEALELISENDSSFKQALDRYKYPNRYEDEDGFGETNWRAEGEKFLQKLEARLEVNLFLFGHAPELADHAIFPFIRQFRMPDPEWFDGTNKVAAPYPQVKRWLNTLIESDIFQAIMPKLKPWEAGDAPLFLQNLK